jgi:hypothetical protein
MPVMKMAAMPAAPTHVMCAAIKTVFATHFMGNFVAAAGMSGMPASSIVSDMAEMEGAFRPPTFSHDAAAMRKAMAAHHKLLPPPPSPPPPQLLAYNMSSAPERRVLRTGGDLNA